MRQLELSLGGALQKERSKNRGVAITLGFAGGVCLIAASAIHRNLLLTVAPAAAGLLGCSAALWITNRKRQGKMNASTQVQSNEKTHRHSQTKMLQINLDILDNK